MNKFKLLLLVSFVNVFIDISHKILLQNTIYKTFDGNEQLLLTTIVNALLLLPFIFLFSTSGFLSDKFPKNKIIKITSFINIFLNVIAYICYLYGAFWSMFTIILIMGIQSCIYSPAKYGYIKELMGKDFISSGNALINAVTMISILLAMALYSFGFEYLYKNSTNYAQILQNISILPLILVFLSILEFILSCKLPTLKKTRNIKFDIKKIIKGETLIKNIKIVYKNKDTLLCIVGISIFYSIIQIYLSAFPSYAKNILFQNNTFDVQFSMIFAGIGIIVGSIIAGNLSKNYIELGLIPFGALGIFLTSLLMPYFDFLFAYYFIFFILGFSGALFVIPLNSLIQYNSKESELGTIIAGSNFIQNIFMVIFLVLACIFIYFNINEVILFYMMIIISFIGSLYVVKRLPFSLVRLLISIAFLQRYKLIVENFKNLPDNGGVLLLGNHISFIDWAIVQMAIPRKIYFVMEKNIYSKWYIKVFLDKFGVIPISNMASKDSLKLISDYIKDGNIVCLFPEGVISRHGHLNEFKSGFEYICNNLNEEDAIILPFYIRGLWGSSFSRSDEEFSSKYRKLSSKRKIVISFGSPMHIHSKKEEVKNAIFELSIQSWKIHCEHMHTIARAWIDTAKKNLSSIAIVDNIIGAISYRKLLSLSIFFAKLIKEKSQRLNIKENGNTYGPKEECIGILLPASMASSLCNISVLLANKITINLNFTSGEKAIKSAINNANIKQIYTSKKFVEKLKEKNLDINSFQDINIIFIEDVIYYIKNKKLYFIFLTIFVSLVPACLLKFIYAKSKNNLEIATILFSSGSEGNPKGIMLNNRNILSNIAQISDVLSASNKDVILSSLPPFHAFGLTITTFLPLLEAIKSVTYPDPTDALGIAKAICKNSVTIMCGTSTFLGIYARNKKIDPLMFESLRIVVSGAEKLKQEVKDAFEYKFHKKIYEGYGATETTPVVSVNLPNKFDPNYWVLQRANKEKSVGMPLPGTAIRIVDPDTFEKLPFNEDGLILIGGHQVMVGYLNNKEKTDEVIKEIDGIRWYNTADKGHLDEDGFLYITDRYSRFAKIGGEMISLGAIEEELSKFIKDIPFCATNIEDSKKGEMVVLLILKNDNFEQIQQQIKDLNIPSIFKPSKIIKVDAIPTLGSGKIDLKGVKELAKKLIIN